jgi:hypothetical protein
MAERRMFAKQIIDSDAFLDMPLSSQCLYFHLAMRADDDGFLNNAKKIQRMLGGSDDDFKILLAKKFIIPFENGVCVVKHWMIHNYIQKDRYKETVYVDEKQKLSIKNNGVYTLDTECIQDVSSLETQVRLGKGSLGKSKVSKELNYDDYPEFLEFWSLYPNKDSKYKALESWVENKPPIQKILNALAWQKESKKWNDDEGAYIPMAVTYLNQKRWQDEQPVEKSPF